MTIKKTLTLLTILLLTHLSAFVFGTQKEFAIDYVYRDKLKPLEYTTPAMEMGDVSNIPVSNVFALVEE